MMWFGLRALLKVSTVGGFRETIKAEGRDTLLVAFDDLRKNLNAFKKERKVEQALTLLNRFSVTMNAPLFTRAVFLKYLEKEGADSLKEGMISKYDSFKEAFFKVLMEQKDENALLMFFCNSGSDCCFIVSSYVR